MPTNTRRPPSKTSIAKYVRNVGKSLALASVDAIVDNAPAMNDFLQQNDEYIKKGFAYVKNPRAAANRAERQSTISRVYQAVGTGLKNFKDDVKSGNLYSSARQDAEMMRMFNEDMGFGETSEDDFNWNEDGETPSSSGNTSISDSFDRAIGAAATAQTTAVAQGTELVIGTTKASTKLVVANMDKLNVSISAGLASIYSNISTTNRSIQTHVENSNKFYEATNELLREQVAMMREFLDIQRSLYAPNRSRGSIRSKKTSLANSMDGYGNINFQGYMENVKKNIENNFGFLGLTNSDPNDVMSPINQVIAMLMDPTKMITQQAMKSILPNTFKNSISSMDKALSSMFSQIVAAVNKKKFDGGFLGTLATIFGINVDNKTNISTKEYKKDAIPFDGITKQAIIETIPGYLARIEAALTGRNARYYNYDEGRWVKFDDISREYKDAHKRSIASANWELRRDLDPVSKSISKKSPGAGKRFQKSVDTMINKIYADNGYFRFDEINGIPAWQYYGFADEKTFARAAAAMSKDTVRGLARKNMRAKEDFAGRMMGKEGAHAIERQLFNNSHEYDLTTGKVSKSGLVKGTGLLSLSYDEKGKNVFHYLREILSRMGNRPKNTEDTRIVRRPRTRTARFRASATTSTSGSEDSDGDADPDGDDTLDDSIWEAIDKERAKEADEAKRASAVSDFIGNALDKSPLGKFLNKFGKSFSKIMSSPINYMTKMLNKADESLFKAMFGESPNLKDKDGKPIKSIFDKIIKDISASFDKITNTISEKFQKNVLEKFNNWFKPLWEKFGGSRIVEDIKGYASKGFDRAKDAVSNTFGRAFVRYGKERYQAADEFAAEASAASGDAARVIRRDMVKRTMNKDQWKKYYGAIRKARNGQVASADEVDGTASPTDAADPGVIASNAFGTRFVTKRGLTMISPGEMIIPASSDNRVLNSMLAGEKRDRSRILNTARRAGYIGLNAKGTVDVEKLKESLYKIYDENKPGASKVAAGGVLGLGAGLLTGVNPLLGAVAGAGISILNNSQTLQKIVFGEDTEDGHIGGIIPKKIQDYFKKAGGDAIDFGVAGGILGLVTGMGPLAGAAVGAGIGFLKNSETVNNALFGEDGIIGPENKEKISKFIKKAAPNALVGAGIGILTGPFGLLGNAAIGAGLGLVTSTNTFHELMFGKEGDEDDRGIFGAFKDGMLNPAIEKMHDILDDFKEYAKKNIFDNLKKFFDPFQQMIKNAVTNIGDGIKDHLNDMFERTIGIPAADFMREKVFKPITKTLGAIIKIPLNVGKAVVAAPFKALGKLGDHMRTRQIQKGTAYDMTAEERLQWRKDHNYVLPFGRDKMKEQDELFASMGEEDLSSIAALAKGELTTREDLGKNLGRARTKSRDTISKYFNKTKTEDGSKSLYDVVGVRHIEKLTKLAANGDLTAFNKYLRTLSKKITPEQMDELNKLISTEITAVKSSMDAVATYDMDRRDKDKEISRILGRKFKGRKDMRNIMRMAESEISGRHKNDPSFIDELEEEESKKEEEANQATIDFRNSIEEKVQGILNNLTVIAQGMQLVINPESNPTAIEISNNSKPSDNDDGEEISPSVEKAIDKMAKSPKKRGISKIFGKLKRGEVVSADEVDGTASDEDSSDSGIIETNAFGKKSTSKSSLSMISPGETIVPTGGKDNFITKIGSSIKNLFTKSDKKDSNIIRVPNPNTGKMMSYDSDTGVPLEDKDTVEALDELEEDKKREEAIVENTKSSSSFMSRIFGGLFGEKKDKGDKKGIFSRITSGLGSMLSFFGIKGSTIAKIGLGVVGLGAGVSLFGFAGDWFKTSVWPTIKMALFGTTDEGGEYSGGLLSGIANKYNDIMYGDGTAEHPGLINKFNTIIHGDGTPENPGLADRIKLFIHGDGTSQNPGLASKIKLYLLGDGTAENRGLLGGIIDHGKSLLFGEKGTFTNPTGGILGWIQGGGIYKFIGEQMIPKLIGGFGLAMNYVVTPLTAMIIKHFPSMLVSLGKAILNGIKIAVFKNEITRDEDPEISADTSDFGNMANNTGTSIASNAGLSQDITKIFSGNTGSSAYGSTSGSVGIDYNSLVDTNYISAENTYDKDGNHLNKTSTEIMYKDSSGLAGLLGRKESTNTMIYDENGNIALRAYDQMNTVDSAGSKALSAVGRSFTHGLLGRSGNGIANAMSNVSTKGGKGIFGIGKKVFGTGVKATGKTASAAHSLGGSLNSFMIKSSDITSFADEIVTASGLTGKGAKALRNQVIETINTKGVDGITDVIDNISATAGKELDDTVLNKGLKLADTLTNGVTKTPSKISTMISNTKSKIANSSIGKAASNIKTSFNESKLGALVNRKSSIEDFAQAAVEAQGLTGKKATKAAKKMTKNIKLNGADAIDNIIGAIDDSKMTSEATENLLQKAINATDNVTKAPTITSKAKNLLTNIGEGVKTSKVGTAVGNVVDAAKSSKTATTIAKVADTTKDVLSGIKSKIVAFFKELAENNAIMKYFKKAAKSDVGEKTLKNAIAGLGEKICNSALGKAAGKALSKIASACAKFIPFVNAALYVADFLWGYDNADTLLGVAKGDEYKVGIGQKCLCGLVHLLNNNFLLGIIPTDTIIDIFVDVLFPLFGLDAASLKAARDRADDILDAWNKAHPEETYTNLEDFNNKDKWTTKAKKAISGAWESVKTGAGKAWEGVKSGASTAWNAVKTGAGKAWEGIKNSKVGQAVGNAASAVSKGVSSIASDIKENGFSAIIDGAKGGYSDAAEDVKNVKAGEYTIFSKEYWTSDAKEDKENPLSTLGTVFGFISRFLQAPSAMLGWVGTKVKKIFTDMVNGAKEGAMDASSDVRAVRSGQYTIFNRQYWTSDADTDNPLSKLGSIFGFITRVFQAPSAMLGWVGTKVKKIFTDMINGAKEGTMDASEDVAAVKAGEYTIFSKDYWSSEEDPDNPLSKLGGIFGFITRIFQAPSAMLGWVGTKVKKVFTDMVDGAKEGIIDASEDVKKVKAGEYTIFNKKYWQTDKDKDSDNPLSKIGSIIGFVTRIFQAPGAMIGWVGSKVKKVFTDMIDGVKDISKDTDSAISRAKKGEISVFGSAYWKINVDEDNPLGGVGKVIGFIQRLFNAPVILIQRAFSSITETFSDAWDWFMGLFGGGKSGSGRGRVGSGRSGGAKESPQNNSEHIYQSDKSIANIRYGNSTIGDSGCAPVAATNLINNIASTEPNRRANLAEAVGFAEKGGYTVKEGGTDMSYFNTYLASKGIPSINTNNKNTALQAIKSGRQVVLLGQDSYNGKNAPYGTNPHFVTATGVDKNGNIIVEDPDLPDNRVYYKPHKLMKSMISSVITGSGIRNRRARRSSIGGKSKARRGMRRVLAGRGKSLGGQAVLNVARSQIGVKEHQPNVVKYNNAYYSWESLGTRTDYNNSQDNYQWCGVFVWWVFNQAGASALFNGGEKACDCISIANYYKRKNKYNKIGPKPGDLAVMNFDGEITPQHIGIVESTSGNTVITIEGNTGDCVARKTRNINCICGFCHIDYPYEYDDTTVVDMSWHGDDTDYKAIAYGGGSMTGDTYSVFVNGHPEEADLISGSVEGSSTTSSANDTIFTKIGNLANSVFKAMYGEDAYQMMFGTTTSSTDTDIDNSDATPLAGNTNSEKIWNYLRYNGYTPAGTAGLMGNLDAESALSPINLQNTFETKLGHTDDSYTKSVNNKMYGKNSFINDKAGYGLAQWTYSSRKKDLYENTVDKGISIGDLGGQLDFLVHELDNKYTTISDLLRTTADINAASDTVLEKFENPAVKNYETRRKMSQKWYDMYKDAGIDSNMSYFTDAIDDTGETAQIVADGATVKPSTTANNNAVTSPSLNMGNNTIITPRPNTGVRPSAGTINNGNLITANIPSGIRSGSGRSGNRIANARTITGPNAMRYAGGATHALNVNSAYADGGGAVAVGHSIKSGTSNSTGVDYETFLQTIVTILLQISDNTALLNTILEILSKNFNLNIDKSELTKAANSRAQAQEALNRAIKNSGGAANMSNMINNRDTSYLLEALRAIAKE